MIRTVVPDAAFRSNTNSREGMDRNPPPRARRVISPLSQYSMAIQLPLSALLADDASFDNFHAGPNALALAAARGVASGDAATGLLFHGPSGSGKSHLLQSMVREAARRGTAAYLPLAEPDLAQPEALAGLEELSLVALDDVDQRLGQRAWALAALRLLDQRRARGLALVYSMSSGPERFGQSALPDLLTRIQAAARYSMKLLNDGELSLLLQDRAARRGLQLSSEVAEFLLRRLPRRVSTLMAAIETLDRAALTAQRRLTIPFVQQALPALEPTAVRTEPG